MKIAIRAVKEEDYQRVAELIYSAELYPQVMWGRGSKDNIIKRLKDLITKEDSRYSSRFIYVAEAFNYVVGLVIFIPLEELKLLDKATDDYLVNNLHRDFKKRFEKHLKSTKKSREPKGREVYISNLSVDEGYKNLEIVRKLVEVVEEKGYLLGYDKICLTTNDIKSMEFYKTLNFVIEEEEFFDHMISFRMVKYL